MKDTKNTNKDFDFFKEETAKEYGFEKWEDCETKLVYKSPSGIMKLNTSLVKEAAEAYAEHQADLVQELFTNPLKKLRPLEDLWRKEHPHPEGLYVVPDATKFYEWIAEKVLNAQHQKEEGLMEGYKQAGQMVEGTFVKESITVKAEAPLNMNVFPDHLSHMKTEEIKPYL